MPTPMPNLKLNFWWMYWNYLIPNGYRLATVEEIRHHFNPRLHHIPPHPLTTLPDRPAPGVQMHLLDGYMTHPSHHHPFHFQLQQTYEVARFKVVVKDKEWDDDAGIWRTKSSACLSSDGVSLRNRLYHHLPLSDSNQARQIALLNGCSDWDTEGLYWLLTTISSSEELKSFKVSFNERFKDYLEGVLSYFGMVGCLLSNNFPFQLPLKPDSNGNTAIDYAIQFAKNPDEVKENHLRVVDLLLELFSCEIVHWKHSNGMSFLDMAQKEGFIHIFTKLLSGSEQPLGNHVVGIKPRFQEILLEAFERGYVPLLEKLFDLKIDMTADRSFLVQVLKNTSSIVISPLFQKLFEFYPSEINVDFVKDKDERTVFHFAAQSDNPHLLEFLTTSFNSINYGLGDVLIKSRDCKGRTPLHIAAAKGNKNTVDKLLVLLGDDRYVRDGDFFGQTALQMASLGGHRDTVKVLVDKGMWDPLKERDFNGKTSLHYAAQGRHSDAAVATCNSQRPLLLWASAGGIGTADEGESVHPLVKTFLQKQKASDRTHLLKQAASQRNVEIAWELLNRGADIDDLRDPHIYQQVEKDYRQVEKDSVKHVLSQLELLKERGRDQPSKEDKLGRNVFAEGLAALFLNRFIESPITVGICGEWGMGKSSVMIQTENILLITAARVTFPNLLKFEDFVGAKRISLSQKGRKIYQTINRGASSFFVQEEEEEDRQEEILLFKLYHKVKEWVKNFLPSARHRFREHRIHLLKF